MKKTITKQDGSTEVVEGTAEEIAEYEKKVKDSVTESPKKVPGLLTDNLERLFGGTVQLRHASHCNMNIPFWLSTIPPVCNCGLIAYPRTTDIIYTTSTSDSTNVT